MTALDDGLLRDLLEYLAKHPAWPTAHIAHVLGREHYAVVASLEALARVPDPPWVLDEPACCGRQRRFTVTDAGLAVLRGQEGTLVSCESGGD